MFNLTSCILLLPTIVSSLFQVYVGVTTDRGAPQQLVVPDGGDGGPAAGSDAAEQQLSDQTAAATHRVHRGETAHQLDVHLPLWLPQGQLLLCLF